MGACMSTGVIEVSEEDKRRNRDVEKELKEVSTMRFNTFQKAYISLQTGKGQTRYSSQGSTTRFWRLWKVHNLKGTQPHSRFLPHLTLS